MCVWSLFCDNWLMFFDAPLFMFVLCLLCVRDWQSKKNHCGLQSPLDQVRSSRFVESFHTKVFKSLSLSLFISDNFSLFSFNIGHIWSVVLGSWTNLFWLLLNGNEKNNKSRKKLIIFPFLPKAPFHSYCVGPRKVVAFLFFPPSRRRRRQCWKKKGRSFYHTSIP